MLNYSLFSELYYKFEIDGEDYKVYIDIDSDIGNCLSCCSE